MPDSDAPNLTGKIIALRYGSGDKQYAYIKALYFEVQAGRQFLVGTTVNTQQSSQAEGVRFCVAWSMSSHTMNSNHWKIAADAWQVGSRRQKNPDRGSRDSSLSNHNAADHARFFNCGV